MFPYLVFIIDVLHLGEKEGSFVATVYSIRLGEGGGSEHIIFACPCSCSCVFLSASSFCLGFLAFEPIT